MNEEYEFKFVIGDIDDDETYYPDNNNDEEE